MIEHPSTSQLRAQEPTPAELALDSRERALRAPSRRELSVDLGLLVLFGILATALALAGGDVGEWSWLDAAVLGTAYALASKIELDVGSGYTVPTQVVLVAALLVLPPALVPLLVFAALLAAEMPAVLRGRLHPLRALICGGDAIHALAPAAVLVLADADTVELDLWPVYLLALAAQCALDLVVTLVRERVRVGVPPAVLLRELRFLYALDIVLSPLGLCAALAAEQEHLAYLLILPVLVFAWMLATERSHRLRTDVALAEATSAAHTDVLTGAVNRRGWDERLAALLAQPAPQLTVALLDVDGLKQLNDTHGHAAGDQLLRAAATAWREVVRPQDTIARIGGDEFAICFDGQTEADVASISERLRSSLPDGHTCSVGVSAAQPGDTARSLLERADQRLYADKRRRRVAALGLLPE